MNAKISAVVICVEAIIYLLLYNLHDCTFKNSRRRQDSLSTTSCTYLKFFTVSIVKDTHMEKAPLNKTTALTKSWNMSIRIVGASNQLFRRGS